MIEVNLETGTVTVTPDEVIAYGLQDIGKPDMDKKVKDALAA